MDKLGSIDWNLVRLFVEVIDAGSMSEVARRRGVTRSSVSQRLARLEQDLEAQLLRRTTRNLRPTAIGQSLYEHGRQIAFQFEAARQDVQSLRSGLRGLVRVSVPPGIGHNDLQPALVEFAAKHPDLALAVTFNNRLGDLIDADIDVALRIMPRAPRDLVVRDLGEVSWHLYCSPQYLQQWGRIDAPVDLADVPFLTTVAAGRYDLALAQDEEVASVTVSPRIVSESSAFLRDAVLSHLGVAQFPYFIVRDLVESGKLVEVLPGYRCSRQDSRVFILTSPNRFRTTAMDAIIDLLEETVRVVLKAAGPR